MAQYKLTRFGCIDTISGASIPADIRNRHWQQYLDWVAAGNNADNMEPEALPLTAAQQAQEGAMTPAMRGLIKALAARLGVTPAQLIQEMKAQA